MTPSASTTEIMVAPASESLPPIWALSPPTPVFNPNVPSQRPRAWERIPKSPFTRGRKGKKVWKRYGAPSKAPVTDMGNSSSQNQDNKVQRTEAQDTTHNAKRLRSIEVSIGGDDGVKQKPSKYVTTLRDQAVGTPRRKAVRRRSLRPDRLMSVAKPASSLEEGPITTSEQHTSVPETLSMEIATTQTTQLLALEEDDTAEIQTDPIQPTEGPLSEDIGEALSSPVSNAHVKDDLASPHHSPDVLPLEVSNNMKFRIKTLKEGATPYDSHGELVEIPRGEEPYSFTLASPLFHQESAALTILSESTEDGDREVTPESTPLKEDTDTVYRSDEGFSVEIQPPNKEQIEAKEDARQLSSQASGCFVRNLRRSSRNSSASKERLSVQATATSTAPPPTAAETSEIEHHVDQNTSKSSSEPGQERSESPSNDRCVERASRDLLQEENSEVTTECHEIRETWLVSQSRGFAELFTPSRIGQENANTIITCASYRESTPANDRATMDDDMHLPIDDGELHGEVSTTVEQPDEKAIGEGSPITLDIDSEIKMLDQEVYNSQNHLMKTRSGTRFSDDTNMLKDFLNRAQARKLAKEITLTPSLGAATAASPRRSQRKALATLDRNSPSPHKPRELADRPGTPPNKPEPKEVVKEDNNEALTLVSPVRRSTRKRLPAAAKTATCAPSFIPVRRTDGTDPVVLQKSVAQELALVTQTNTRRNKGQSKPPAVILKSLPTEVVEEGTKGGHALRNCKSVGWDRKLVYYQDGTETIIEVENNQGEEKRPKARRVRGLGAGNGTPAPKRKTADMLKSNGTPGSKRHGRAR
ncbi:MAG: hypothetical protein Q9209_007671 [Squamulea sp. 1 TL-2023]